ncbi:MAG: GxxExxY protein [Chitinophagales bacterium]
MTENELSRIIVDIAFKIHTSLGPGLFENVYEEILEYELKDSGLLVEKQKPVFITWAGNKIRKKAFKADLIVEDKVLIELKSIETLTKVHYKQVRTYLILTDIKLGLLINFNEELIKNGIHRIVNKL